MFCPFKKKVEMVFIFFKSLNKYISSIMMLLFFWLTMVVISGNLVIW